MGFGGVSKGNKLHPNNDLMVKFDTYKPRKGWKIIELQNPKNKNGSFYGVPPLGFAENSDKKYEFLIFGC